MNFTSQVDVERAEGLALKYNVDIVPTFLFLKDGKVVDRLAGFNPPELNRLMRKYLDASVISSSHQQSQSVASDDSNQLEVRLKKLINQNDVMVFMKGFPDAPKCGFSRQIVEILRGEKCEFGSFDILSDEAVRQGLKEYSKWPTYPQLYVKGELIGGLDIVKELKSSGELSQALGLS